MIVSGARCVNPLTWSTDETFVSAVKNPGAVIQMPNGSIKRIPHFTGTKIDPVQGGLVIPTPSIDSNLRHDMGPAVYHDYDYDFFYDNLRENVSVRAMRGLKKCNVSGKPAAQGNRDRPFCRWDKGSQKVFIHNFKLNPKIQIYSRYL